MCGVCWGSLCWSSFFWQALVRIRARPHLQEGIRSAGRGAVAVLARLGIRLQAVAGRGSAADPGSCANRASSLPTRSTLSGGTEGVPGRTWRLLAAGAQPPGEAGAPGQAEARAGRREESRRHGRRELRLVRKHPMDTTRNRGTRGHGRNRFCSAGCEPTKRSTVRSTERSTPTAGVTSAARRASCSAATRARRRFTCTARARPRPSAPSPLNPAPRPDRLFS